MIKKIYWTLPALIPISLPVFFVISCSSQANQSGVTEASEFLFLTFKSELVQAASQTPLSNAGAIQTLKNSLLQRFPYDPNFKTGLKNLDVKIEGEFFVFDYELETPKGSIWDITVQTPNQFPTERETLKGTIKATGRKN